MSIVREFAESLWRTLHREATRAGATLCAEPDVRERWWGLAVALAAAVAVAAGVTPELALDCPDLNDSAFHVALALRAEEAGGGPADFWYPDVGLGFPLFRHYQHLPHLTLVVFGKLLGGSVPLPTLYRVLLGLLLALFPLSIFFSIRRFGLSPLAAGGSALVAPLLSTPHLYGLGLESYLWGGSGLYAQLFASVLLPPAIAESYRAVRTGRGMWLAAALIAATFLSQLVYGYIAALSPLAFLVPPGERRRRAARVAVLLTAAFLAGSYFFVPALQASEFANHSVWEDRQKWDSLGAAAVLRHLLTGSLFDHGRWPVVSVLVGVGLVYALWRGSEQLRMIAGLFGGWLLLYFGRPTWGMFIDLLPQASDIPLHRFVGGVHLFAIPLAGTALALILRGVGILRGGGRAYLGAAVLVLLLLPVLLERRTYAANSLTWKRESAAAVAADRDLEPLLARLETLTRGRVYVGLPNRPDENLRVGAVPLNAFCLTRGIDTLGFLWIAITYAGDIQVWFNPDDETMCRTFGVRYLVFDATRRPPEFARLIGKFGRYALYEVDGVSYFGVIDVPCVVYCTKRSVYEVGFAWLRSRLPPRQVHPGLFVGGHGLRDLPVFVPSAAESDGGFSMFASEEHEAAGLITEAFDKWSCKVELVRPAAVMLRASFHPGLRATVDGLKAEVFPVAPGFAAVRVAEGRHVVRFWYQPATRWPWLLAGAMALVLANPAGRGAAWLVSGGRRREDAAALADDAQRR